MGRLTGGCLCGSVRYRLDETPQVVVNCHCGMCRKHSGAAFLTYAAISNSAFTLESGELTGYRSSAEAVRTHCAVCGSSLTFTFENDPSCIWVTVGSLDEAGSLLPTENWFVDDKIEWVQLNHGLKNWSGAPE